MPELTPVLGEAIEKDLVQWALVMQKQSLPVGRDILLYRRLKRYTTACMDPFTIMDWLVVDGENYL